MQPEQNENVYMPKVAVVDCVTDEIADVKTFHWRFEDPAEQEAFRCFRPGQFAQVSLFGIGEFPASLPPSPTEDQTFFTVRRVGACTAALHELSTGDRFGVRGPYGNGFPMEDYRDKDLLFVAGGIGLIPLRSCIVYALAHRTEYGRIQVFYGARTPRELMYLSDIARWEQSGGLECHLTVDRGDDAWREHVGVVGSLFKEPGVEVPVGNTIAFVCGPPVMFRFVIKDLLGMGIPEHCIVSTLERYMKCGVGKCGHCCIGAAYVCADGPVFTYQQLRKLGEGHLMSDLCEKLRRCLHGRVCLMGLGNAEHGDDGFGVRLAEALQDAPTGGSAHSSFVAIVAGTNAESMLGRATEGGFDHLVFLDAVDFDGKPGSVIFLDATGIVARFPQVSTHGMSLGLLARLAEGDGAANVWLLGVQPSSLQPALGLTPPVQASFEVLYAMIRDVLGKRRANEAVAARTDLRAYPRVLPHAPSSARPSGRIHRLGVQSQPRRRTGLLTSRSPLQRRCHDDA